MNFVGAFSSPKAWISDVEAVEASHLEGEG
jgi:hypothetical protein